MLTLAALPTPAWPVVVLAVVTLGDAFLCLRPVPFVAQCFRDVGWPREYWPVMAPVKFLAGAALVAGLWVSYLGTAASVALVVYFIVAIAMHIRAKDFGRNLFLNACGMLVICVAVAVVSFLGTAP